MSGDPSNEESSHAFHILIHSKEKKIQSEHNTDQKHSIIYSNKYRSRQNEKLDPKYKQSKKGIKQNLPEFDRLMGLHF